MAANYLHKRYPKMPCTLYGDLYKEIENVFTQGIPRLEEYDGKLQKIRLTCAIIFELSVSRLPALRKKKQSNIYKKLPLGHNYKEISK